MSHWSGLWQLCVGWWAWSALDDLGRLKLAKCRERGRVLRQVPQLALQGRKDAVRSWWFLLGKIGVERTSYVHGFEATLIAPRCRCGGTHRSNQLWSSRTSSIRAYDSWRHL